MWYCSDRPMKLEMKEVVLKFANERGALPNLGCRRRYAAFGKASQDIYTR